VVSTSSGLDIATEVNRCLGDFRLADALDALHAVGPDSSAELIAQKIKVMCLVNDTDNALALYKQCQMNGGRLNIEVEMAAGLLGSLRFDEGVELLVQTLKANPESTQPLNMLFFFLVTFNAFDDLLVLLDKPFIKVQMIPAGFLLRLAVRLQIKQRTGDSQRVLALYMARFQGMPPMQLPWLLMSHGEKLRADNLLIEQSKHSQQHHTLLQTHVYYLKAELPELFKKLSQGLGEREVPVKLSPNLRFMAILDNQIPIPPAWESIDNRIVWRYLWQYEGRLCNVEQWFFQKSVQTALGNSLAPLLSSDEGVKCLLQRKGNLEEKVIKHLHQYSNQPVVFVASHSIVPGAIASLLTLMPDLHYVKSAVIPLNGIRFDKQTINLGPRFMATHNLSELTRMNELVKANKKLLVFMDQRDENPKVDQHQHKLAGHSVFYNDFFANYVWNKGLLTLWIDARYVNGELDYELEEMPNPAQFNEQAVWESNWMASYHSHVKVGFYGDKGVGNNSFHLAETLIPQAFKPQFERISGILAAG
jgi:hypothetical protein